jgi:topoisomerase IV subunit B
MTGQRPTTTHDWARQVDAGHLAGIRQDPATFAPGGLQHLILEVTAYAADEAGHSGGGECAITLHADGSVSVADHGRGTATRAGEQGAPVRKPVAATKDLRFFDHPGTEALPDGHPRRGLSVVAALSARLIHANRRRDGSWTQEYEHGIPVTDLVPVAGDGTTGTTIRFYPDRSLRGDRVTAHELARLTASWRFLAVEIDDRRAG